MLANRAAFSPPKNFANARATVTIQHPAMTESFDDYHRLCGRPETQSHVDCPALALSVGVNLAISVSETAGKRTEPAWLWKRLA